MTLNLNGAMPLYIQIKELLQDEIDSGRIAIGARLPSERELAEAYGVSRMTARQALQLLQQNGYTRRQVGKGTYASRPGIDQELNMSGPAITASATNCARCCATRVERSVPVAEVDSPMLGARQYMAAVRSMLDRIAETQLDAIAAAADAIIRSFRQDGLLYIFGTGHSHLMAEEGHYRAGGLAPVVPMVSSSLMLHEGAVVSTRLERLSGMGEAMLTRYSVTDCDTVIVYSNSGVNAAPVEAAMAAKARGMTVIAVVARAYASAAPAGATGRKLAEIADIVIDNQGVPGDALVEVQATGLRVGPASTITGAFILNSILTEVAWRLADAGGDLPIYISANMPGAVAHNAALVARFRPRNPHL